MKKPKRILRRPEAPPMPPIPPQIEMLRDARKRIAPWETYRFELPGGRAVEMTGAEMIREAEGMVAIADAQRRGDMAGMARAVARILEGR